MLLVGVVLAVMLLVRVVLAAMLLVRVLVPVAVAFALMKVDVRFDGVGVGVGVGVLLALLFANDVTDEAALAPEREEMQSMQEMRNVFMVKMKGSTRCQCHWSAPVKDPRQGAKSAHALHATSNSENMREHVDVDLVSISQVVVSFIY